MSIEHYWNELKINRAELKALIEEANELTIPLLDNNTKIMFMNHYRFERKFKDVNSMIRDPEKWLRHEYSEWLKYKYKRMSPFIEKIKPYLTLKLDFTYSLKVAKSVGDAIWQNCIAPWMLGLHNNPNDLHDMIYCIAIYDDYKNLELKKFLAPGPITETWFLDALKIEIENFNEILVKRIRDMKEAISNIRDNDGLIVDVDASSYLNDRMRRMHDLYLEIDKESLRKLSIRVKEAFNQLKDIWTYNTNYKLYDAWYYAGDGAVADFGITPEEGQDFFDRFCIRSHKDYEEYLKNEFDVEPKNIFVQVGRTSTWNIDLNEMYEGNTIEEQFDNWAWYESLNELCFTYHDLDHHYYGGVDHSMAGEFSPGPELINVLRTSTNIDEFTSAIIKMWDSDCSVDKLAPVKDANGHMEWNPNEVINAIHAFLAKYMEEKYIIRKEVIKYIEHFIDNSVNIFHDYIKDELEAQGIKTNEEYRCDHTQSDTVHDE